MQRARLILLFLVTFANPARADSCLDRLRRFIFVAAPEQRFALDASLLEQQIAQSEVTWAVKQMSGVTTHLDTQGQYLGYLYGNNLGVVESPELRTVKVFVVDAIKPIAPGKTDRFTPFFEHPDAPALLARIQARRTAIVIDPALEVEAKRLRKVGGYHLANQLSIGIGVKTPYRVVEHEYTHLLFQDLVMEPFLRSEAFTKYAALETRAADQVFQYTNHEFAERLIRWTADQDSLNPQQVETLRLYSRSVKTTEAISETFATEGDLHWLDTIDYPSGGIGRTFVMRYQTYHQLADLESRFATLSRSDQMRWAQLKWRSIYLGAQVELYRSVLGQPPVVRAALIAALGSVATAVLRGVSTKMPTTRPATGPPSTRTQ